MKAVVYTSITGNSKEISKHFEGDIYEIKMVRRMPKLFFFKFMMFGFFSVANRFQKVTCDIDLDKYDEITFISAIHANSINILMRSFLKQNQFKNKNVRLVITRMDKNFYDFSSYLNYIDDSNNIIEKTTYLKKQIVRSDY